MEDHLISSVQRVINGQCLKGYLVVCSIKFSQHTTSLVYIHAYRDLLSRCITADSIHVCIYIETYFLYVLLQTVYMYVHRDLLSLRTIYCRHSTLLVWLCYTSHSYKSRHTTLILSYVLCVTDRPADSATTVS